MNPRSNYEFMAAVFGLLMPGDPHPWVTGFPGDPEISGTQWAGKPWDCIPGSTAAAGFNWYATLATYRDPAAGRTFANCAAVHGVMLDDVGTKARNVDHLLPYSYIIETSPGNRQAGYLFDGPTAPQTANDLNNAMREGGVCDKNAVSPATEWCRLPFASNTKAKYGGFVCKLIAWRPEARYSLETIVVALGLSLSPARATAAAPCMEWEARPEAERAEIIADLRAALKHIPADDRDEWIARGQNLRTLGEDGRLLWTEWSRTSGKYEPGAEDRFDGFKGDASDYRAVFTRAGAFGWENPKRRNPNAVFGTVPPQLPEGAQPAAARTATPPATATMSARTAAPFLDAARQAQLFDGCTYVVDDDRVLLPTGEMVNAPRFKVLFGGYVFMMDARNERTTRNAYEAFTESQVLAPPIANGTCFKPLEPFGAMFESEGRRRVNIYTPAKVARKVGDPKPLLDHLALLLPDRHDRDVLTYYMAGVVQHQGHKFQWFPLIVGPEGNGKTVFSRCVARAVGERFSHWPKQAEIGSKFNGWLSGKTFIAIEDLKLDDDGQTWEKMKPMVTGDRLEIESKGIDQRTEEVCCNFIANSNHRDAVKAASDARRIAHLWCAQETSADLQRDGMGEAYFRDLYNWLNNSDGYAIVAEWLHTMHVPAAFGLAWLKGRAPQTSTTARAVEDSRSDEERAVLDAIENLEVGFHGGWISSSYLAQRTQRLSAAQRKALLLRIGYVPHPALERGGKHQVDNAVEPDGCKPTLYVRQGTPAEKVTERAGVAAAYTRAQVADLKAAIKKRDDEEAKRKAAAATAAAG